MDSVAGRFTMLDAVQSRGNGPGGVQSSVRDTAKQYVLYAGSMHRNQLRPPVILLPYRKRSSYLALGYFSLKVNTFSKPVISDETQYFVFSLPIEKASLLSSVIRFVNRILFLCVLDGKINAVVSTM